MDALLHLPEDGVVEGSLADDGIVLLAMLLALGCVDLALCNIEEISNPLISCHAFNHATIHPPPTKKMHPHPSPAR